MRTRYRLTLLLAIGVAVLARPTRTAAQIVGESGRDLRDFAYADSLTAVWRAQGRWRALDSAGRLALGFGTDYPALRRRLGEAAQQTGHPSAALRHYGRALRADPLDTAARYGLAVAHLALGQIEPATLQAHHLTAALRRPLHLRARGWVQRAELEASGQTNTSHYRGLASFGRLSLTSQISSRFWLTQAVARYGQSVELPEQTGSTTYAIRQWEYHGLLTGQLSLRWQARAGFTALASDFGAVKYPGWLAYGAVVYQHPYFTAQIGHYAGSLTDSARSQTDLRLAVYPLGNLRFYCFGRASRVVSGGRAFPNGLVGVGARLRPWCWLEGFGSAGRVPVLAEQDGAYVYNLLDPQQWRGGVGAYFVGRRHLSLRLFYTAERRTRALHRDGLQADYSIYALTTALVWTW